MGPLGTKNTPKEVMVAYSIWRNQRYRCSKKTYHWFHNYGGRGIKVLYSSRDFVNWYLKEVNKQKWDRPTVGRIDHNGHYEFSNIRIEEWNYNCVEEPRSRLGCFGERLKVKILALSTKDGSFRIYDCLKDAADGTNTKARTIRSYLCGQNINRGKFGFIYYRFEDWIKDKNQVDLWCDF